MAGIFLRMLEVTAVSSAIILAVFIFRVILAKKIKPGVTGMLWALVLLRLCLPVTLESPVHLPQLIPQRQEAVEEQPADTGALDPAVDYQPESDYVSDEYEFTPQTGAVNQPSSAYRPAANDFSVDWLAIAAYVWIAGAAAILLNAVWKGALFGRRVKRCKAYENAVHIADCIKPSLRIRRSISVKVCADISAPVLFGLFKPQILLPESCRSVDSETLRCILTHELCHVKRHDILKGYIWLIAKAAHWFNPFVWLAYAACKDDIELCCDDKVLRLIGNNNRFVYTQSLIDSFRAYRRALPAAMPLFESKPKLTERVMRMLKPYKRSKTAAALSVLLALIMLVAGFTTACTPAAETAQTIDTPLLAAIEQPEQTANAEETEEFTYSAPQTWKSEVSNDSTNVNIKVNAQVSVPTDRWGAYLLSLQQVTKEDIQKILNAIVGDAVIKEKKTLLSKQGLEGKIAKLEASKAYFEKMLKDGDYSEEGQTEPSPAPSSYGENGPVYTKKMIEENIEIFTGMIEEARQQLANASDEEKTVESVLNLDSIFNELTENTKPVQSFEGTADTGKSTPAFIYMDISNNGFSLNYIDYDDYEKSFGGGYAYTGQPLFKCNISMEDAEATAREKVTEMGLDGLDIDTVQVCDMLDRKRAEGDKFPECFMFVFKTKMDGATATYAHGVGVYLDGETMPRQLPQRQTTVYVDDSGVIGVRIEEMKAQLSRQSYGIKLLGFDKVMDIFKEQIFIKNPYYSGKVKEDYVIGREVHIKNIRLGYMPVYSGSGEEITFIPVWDFFGEEITTYKEGVVGDLAEFLDRNNQMRRDLGIQSVLTINAIDGSIVER